MEKNLSGWLLNTSETLEMRVLRSAHATLISYVADLKGRRAYAQARIAQKDVDRIATLISSRPL